jgi:transcriptional regulator with XRE-family HTH domain
MSMLRGKPCAPEDRFPFMRHRTLAEVFASTRLLKRWEQAEAAAALEARRKALGISYERLGEIAGICSRHAWRVLSGRTVPNDNTLSFLAGALERGEGKERA